MLSGKGENPFLRGKPAKEHVDFVFHEQSDLFGGLQGADREMALAEIARNAEQQFSASLENIQKAIRIYNPFQLLAHFGYYDQLVLESAAENPEYEPVEQSAVEWLQALILQIPEEEINATLENEPDGRVLTELNKELHRAQKGFGMKRIGRKVSEPAVSHAAELIRQHTAFVRNEGYPSQIKRMRHAIFSPLDDEFEKREGIKLSEYDAALWRLTDFFKEKLDSDLLERRKILRHDSPAAIIAAFSTLIGEDCDVVAADMAHFSHDIEAVRRAITFFIDSRNYRHFYFKAEQFQSLFDRPVGLGVCKRILKGMSITWGALHNLNPEHLILANPVWKKPFIDVGNDSYFLPIVAMIQSFGLDVLENALEVHQDLKTKYRSRTRAEFLEKRVEELVRKAFGKGRVFRGLKWKDDEGKEGETDVLVVLDGHALVFECKSAAIRARAQRGDPAALKQELKQLIEEPSLQSRRFEEAVLAKRSKVKLVDVSGVSHEIDFSGLLRVTTVNVLLDYVGPVATQFRLLKDAGVHGETASAVATIALHDLECVLDILNRPALAFHYLRRRAELETNCEIIAIGELSLLALYLGTSFDLGDFEGAESHKLMVPNLNKELDPYFMGQELNVTAVRPSLKLTPWWKDMLEKFEKKAFPGWVEASYTLLCTSYERQSEFEKLCETLKEEVLTKSGIDHDNTCIMINGGKGGRVAIIGIAIGKQTREEARRLASDRISMVEDEYEAVRSLAICYSAAGLEYPYLGVYSHCPELELLGERSGALNVN